jgi:hypothetical protein
VEHMKNTGEWGEFFLAGLSPFAYNETVAQELFPLTQEAAAAGGLRWREQAAEAKSYMGPAVDVPDDIAGVDDAIAKSILHCEITGKPYKIIPQELAFYRQMKLPLPRKCPDQRHAERLAIRNPRRLWKRPCAACAKEMETAFAPGRPETVYCEECYLKAVY